MGVLLLGLLAVTGAGAWLVLLVVTEFNLLTVSLGLFALLCISGRNA